MTTTADDRQGFTVAARDAVIQAAMDDYDPEVLTGIRRGAEMIVQCCQPGETAKSYDLSKPMPPPFTIKAATGEGENLPAGAHTLIGFQRDKVPPVDPDQAARLLLLHDSLDDPDEIIGRYPVFAGILDDGRPGLFSINRQVESVHYDGVWYPHGYCYCGQVIPREDTTCGDAACLRTEAQDHRGLIP
jgi:hypothetical protein